MIPRTITSEHNGTPIEASIDAKEGEVLVGLKFGFFIDRRVKLSYDEALNLAELLADMAETVLEAALVAKCIKVPR
jgi:hypothetical protein